MNLRQRVLIIVTVIFVAVIAVTSISKANAEDVLIWKPTIKPSKHQCYNEIPLQEIHIDKVNGVVTVTVTFKCGSKRIRTKEV